ncbi:nickel/cobalt exporter [Candidatus Electrothrix aarhusensis]|uniref:Nickel/cobalt efflux system n=1 Tax=Candidatus Electrothrix aarhusensis TaxID=1859131 RepID=A0A444IV55_9BACT|nr:nickel/cobalt exporter [Candidatus Electrothrix aarhusensis]
MTNLFMLYSGAVALGALHAFEPGHGKTLIAAYMIGTRGRAWDGLLLGAIVTITHTFSVILLGIIAKILSKTYSDEILHDWLGLISATIIMAVGVWMLRQRLSGKSTHQHVHLFGKGHSHEHHHPHTHKHSHDTEQDDHHASHDHNHDDHNHNHALDGQEHVHEHHHPHEHDHVHDGSYHEHPHHSHERVEKKPIEAEHKHHTHNAHNTQHDHGSPEKNTWELFMLGVSGGIIPCPAAIATLLAAIAAGKIAQGLSVTLFFSLGLGMVMMSIGVALSQAGRLTDKISENLNFARSMGIVSALLIMVLGSYTMFHSVKNIWF